MTGMNNENSQPMQSALIADGWNQESGVWSHAEYEGLHIFEDAEDGTWYMETDGMVCDCYPQSNQQGPQECIDGAVDWWLKVEIEKGVKNIVPSNRKPRSPEEWDRLAAQRQMFASRVNQTYKECKESDAPLFLRQLVARNRHQMTRKWKRTLRRATTEKHLLCRNLLHVLENINNP